MLSEKISKLPERRWTVACPCTHQARVRLHAHVIQITCIQNTLRNENKATSSGSVWPRGCPDVKSPLPLSAVCLSLCVICLSSLFLSCACVCLLYLFHPDKGLLSVLLAEHHRKMAHGGSEGFFIEINRVLQDKKLLYWSQMIQKDTQNQKRYYQRMSLCCFKHFRGICFV